MAYKTMASLENAILSKLEKAVKEMSDSVKKNVDESIEGYYQEYIPILYERTGKMKTTPKIKKANFSNNGVSYELYLNTNISYETGTWTMQQVLESANLGKHGGFYVRGHIGVGGLGVWEYPLFKAHGMENSLWRSALLNAGLPIK